MHDAATKFVADFSSAWRTAGTVAAHMWTLLWTTQFRGLVPDACNNKMNQGQDVPDLLDARTGQASVSVPCAQLDPYKVRKE